MLKSRRLATCRLLSQSGIEAPSMDGYTRPWLGVRHLSGKKSMPPHHFRKDSYWLR